MASTTLESVRAAHEEVEQFEDLITAELEDRKKKHREIVLQVL